METQEIIAQINAISTIDDMERVDALIRSQPGKMAPEVQAALLDKLREVTLQSKAAREQIIEETKSALRLHGVEYPLTDWLTPANYARQFGIDNVATVTNWIKREIIPSENVKEIPELGIRLVRAVKYNPRPYATAAGEEKDA